MKRQLLDKSRKLLAEANPFDLVWGIELRVDDPDAHDPRLWREHNLLGQDLSTVLSISVATTRPVRHTPPLFLNYVRPHRPSEFMRLTPLNCCAFGFRQSFASVVLRSYRSIFLTRQVTTAPMCRLSPLAPSLPSWILLRSSISVRTLSEAQ